MILDGSRRLTKKGSLGLAAVVTLSLWGVFVLGGPAQAEDVSKKTVTVETTAQDTPQGPKVIVRMVGADGTPISPDGNVRVRMFKLGDKNDAGLKDVIVNADCNVQGQGIAKVLLQDGTNQTMQADVAFAGCFADNLQDFAKDHPTADANTDGSVTAEERDAFLVATALGDSAAFLAQFPEVDLNKDAQLDASEAARLLTRGTMQFMKINAMGDAGPSGPTPHIFMMRGDGPMAADAGEKTMICQLAKAQVDADDAEDVVGPSLPREFNIDVRTDGPMKQWNTAPAPSEWLLANNQYVPSRAEVTQQIATVQQTALARFLEIHPDADANKDGRLSEEERASFLEAESANVRSKLLKHFPEADANHDGTLTEQELQDHFARQRPAEAAACAPANGGKMTWVSAGGEEKDCIVVCKPGCKPANCVVTCQTAK